MDAFIERANIERYRLALATESDETKRQLLLRLLAEAEALQRIRIQRSR